MKKMKPKTTKKKSAKFSMIKKSRTGTRKRASRKKSVKFNLAKKSLFKLVAILLLFGLNGSGLLAIGKTQAYFNDEEKSEQNIYTATTLDLSATALADFSPLVTPSQTSTKEIIISNVGGLDFQYNASSTDFSGDADLCAELTLNAALDSINIYSGKLFDFIAPTSTLATSSSATLDLDVSLPNSDISLQNKTCNFNLVFTGWQIDLPDASQGFSDTEIIANSVSSGSWNNVLINKVYYDVDASHGTDANNEWLELYNPSETPIDLSGWKICDNTSCDTLSDSNIIPAGGFAIVTNSSTTWNYYWEIPDDIIKIALNNSVGGGLGNTADMLVLKNPDGLIIDQLNWGTPVSTWANWNSNLWNPGATDVPDGHMLSRVPTGYDTDQASDFVDLGPPQITVVSPNGGEVWWVGRTSTVEWLATNSNGADSALSIDLWYSSDSGVTWGNIVKGIANTGSYNFRVPLCFDDGHGDCYYAPSETARVKAVAWGPENFMVQDWDMSDEDFCPPIDYSLLLPEEIEMLKSMGLWEGGDEILLIDELIIEIATTTDELATTTAEVATTTPENTAPPLDPADNGGGEPAIEPAIETPADSGESSDDSSALPAETTEPSNNPSDNPADNPDSATGDSSSQPADTTENIPVAPTEVSEDNPAIEPEPAINVEPPAPVEPNPGPDPVPSPDPVPAAPAEAPAEAPAA